MCECECGCNAEVCTGPIVTRQKPACLPSFPGKPHAPTASPLTFARILIGSLNEGCAIRMSGSHTPDLDGRVVARMVSNARWIRRPSSGAPGSRASLSSWAGVPAGSGEVSESKPMSMPKAADPTTEVLSLH